MLHQKSGVECCTFKKYIFNLKALESFVLGTFGRSMCVGCNLETIRSAETLLKQITSGMVSSNILLMRLERQVEFKALKLTSEILFDTTEYSFRQSPILCSTVLVIVP